MHDLQRYLVEEFAEEYLDGEMSRRDLLRRVLLVTGSTAVAATALAALGVRTRRAEAAAPLKPRQHAAPYPTVAGLPAPTYQLNGTAPPPAQTTDNVVDPGDPFIQAGMVTFGGAAGDVFGYLAQPSAAGIYPGIIVVHENRGLIEPIMDIARRYAKEGYAALAVDLVSRAGGTASLVDDPMQATGFLGRSDPGDLVSDLLSGMSWLAERPGVDHARMAATGFCFGGGLVWRLAEAAGTDLRAGVPFYGPNPPLDDVPRIGAALLGIYGALDTRITGASTDLDTALDAAGKTHDKWIAPEANHAFFNNTGAAYNPAAAMEGWLRALSWFATYLA